MLRRVVSNTWWWEVESSLLLLQGLVAWWSDCHTLGTTSWSHVADRIMAPTLVLWFTTRTFFMLGGYFPDCVHLESWWSMSVILLLVTFPVSLWIFAKAMTANHRDREYEKFLFWHGVWHISLPLFGSSFVLLMKTLEVVE